MPFVLEKILDLLIHYLWHLWGAPRGDVPLICPVVEGMPIDPNGVFDSNTVANALALTGRFSLAVVVILVLFCYLATPYSTGPWFTRRWARFTGASAVLAFLVPLIVMLLAKTRAAPGTCETDLSAFQVQMPIDVILVRASAGLLWGPIVFVIASLILTQTVGRFNWGGGFFHNRGCPWPRLFHSKD